jgi:RNA 2',3'-cyclic 3'-phosphodiesterase
MRLFVAISLTPEVIDALERFSQSLRSTGDNLRWTSPETWHITLQFLGETSNENFGCVVQQLRKIGLSPVPVRLHGAGVFDRAGVFWAGVTVSSELRLLEKAVTTATSGCGFTSESRPYHPHVTLARAKGKNAAQALLALKTRVKEDQSFPEFTAREFLLYESFLSSEGARHEVRQRFPLA